MSPRPLVPREVLYGIPEHQHPRFSPDGTRLAWLAPSDGRLTIWTADAEGDGARPLLSTERNVARFRW